MTDKKRITELYGVTLEPRVIIRPKASVSVSTPAQREDVLRAARRVMTEHYDVLVALKNR
jgi:hypothetical protein